VNHKQAEIGNWKLEWKQKISVLDCKLNSVTQEQETS